MDATRTVRIDDWSTDNPHPVDLHVGQRIFFARRAKGMSQQGLAERLRMSFQQVQKYEKGRNRVSASVLYEMMNVLHVSASYFFEGIETEAGPPGTGAVTDAEAVEAMTMYRENFDILRDYLQAPPAVRKAIRSLLNSLAKESPQSVP